MPQDDSGYQLLREDNGQTSAGECVLAPGASCDRIRSSDGITYKNGGDGKTRAEFAFNTLGLDFYDLLVIDGFDVAMSISSSNGGPTITCSSSDCPDAYHNPNENKVHTTQTGGTFTITFCP